MVLLQGHKAAPVTPDMPARPDSNGDPDPGDENAYLANETICRNNVMTQRTKLQLATQQQKESGKCDEDVQHANPQTLPLSGPLKPTSADGPIDRERYPGVTRQSQRDGSVILLARTQFGLR